LSWGAERQTLSVNSLAAVVVGLDGEDAIVFLRDTAALISDSDDVEEFLADVGRDNEIATLRSQRHLAKDGVYNKLKLYLVKLSYIWGKLLITY